MTRLPALPKRGLSKRVSAGFFKRRVVPVYGARWPFGGNPVDDFDALIKQRIERLAQAEIGTGFRVVLRVTIERRDGMTWDAERARAQIVASVDGDWSVRFLSGSEDLQAGALDELSALFGDTSPVRRAARNAGLIPGGHKDWLRWLLFSALAVICVVGGGLVSSQALEAGPSSGAIFGAVAAAALALLARNLDPGRLPLTSNKLEQALEQDHTRSDFDVRFAEQLHREFRRAAGKRAIVIDDFGKLRRRTIELVERYLWEPGERGDEELWIVFERGRRSAGGGKHRPGSLRLSKLSIDDSFDGWICRQQPLDIGEKRRLVRTLRSGPVLRTDPRLRSRAVADVVGDRTDEDLSGELAEQLRDVDANLVRMFALLALAATVPDPAPIQPRDITEALYGPTAGTGPIRRLLAEWFEIEPPRPAAVQDEARETIKELESLFEERPRRRRAAGVSVSTAYADALVSAYPELRAAHELPFADAGRAFWALMWHRDLRSLSPWGAPLAERLISQICNLREPARIGDRYGGDVARALCEAGMFAAEAALALGVAGIVADIPASADEIDRNLIPSGAVERTHHLIAGRDASAERKLLEQLLGLAWCCYMLSGREELLTTISAIWQEVRPEEASADRLSTLYLETLPCREPLGFSPRVAAGDPVVDHARVRAAWLAQLLRPLARSTDSEWLQEVSQEGDLAMREIAERLSERLEHAGGDNAYEWLDYNTLGFICFWHSMRADNHEPATPGLLDTLRRCVAAVERQLGERAGPGDRANFLLEGLLHQARAIASGSIGELDDLHIMWQNLEMFELADIAALARNFFANAGRDQEDEGVADYLVGLDDSEGRPMNRAASELMIGVKRLGQNLKRSGTPLVRAACVVIDAELGLVLTFELCKLLTTQDFMTIDEEHERVLARALDPPDGCKGVFDVPDAEVAERLRPLINHARGPDSAIADRLREIVRLRRESIENPWNADLVDQRLEYGEIGHGIPPESSEEVEALLERWRGRIWNPEMAMDVAEDASAGRGVRVGEASASTPADVLYEYTFASAPRARATQEFLHSYGRSSRTTYAFILLGCWSALGKGCEGVFEDAVRLLRESDDCPMAMGYVLLADRVCERLAERGEEESNDFKHALSILRDHIAEWESVMEPSINHSIYKRLAAHDTTSSTNYLAKANEWRMVGERIEEERLFLQVVDRQAFEVFWHHFTHRELPCDMSNEEVMAGQSPAGEQPARPLINGHNGRAHLSGAYLRLGHSVFHLHPEVPEFDELRGTIQRLANENVRALYDFLIALSTKAPELRQLFERQRKRFDEI